MASPQPVSTSATRPPAWTRKVFTAVRRGTGRKASRSIPRGLLRRDVLEDGHGAVQVAVAHGRHDGVADAPVVDSRHLPVGHAGHAPLLLLGRPAG
jgi:hypothetical protein